MDLKDKNESPRGFHAIHESLRWHEGRIKGIAALNREHLDPAAFGDAGKADTSGFDGRRLADLLVQASRFAHEAQSRQEKLLSDMAALEVAQANVFKGLLQRLKSLSIRFKHLDEELPPGIQSGRRRSLRKAFAKKSPKDLRYGYPKPLDGPSEDFPKALAGLLSSVEQSAEMRGVLAAVLELDEVIYCAERVASGGLKSSNDRDRERDSVRRWLRDLLGAVELEHREWSRSQTFEHVLVQFVGATSTEERMRIRKRLYPKQKAQPTWWPKGMEPDEPFLSRNEPEERRVEGRFCYFPSESTLKSLLRELREDRRTSST